MEENENISLPWIYGKELEISGEKLPITRFREYNFHAQYGTYKSEHFLVGDDVFLIYSVGIADAEVFNRAFQNLEYLLNDINKKELHLIWDATEVTGITVRVRKSLLNISDKFSKYFIQRYVCTKKEDAAIFTLFNYFTGDRKQYIEVLGQPKEALLKIFDYKKFGGKEEPDETEIEREALQNLSKEELIDKIIKEKGHFKKQSDVLMKAFSSVSWNNNFEPVELYTTKDDPFYNLFKGATLLQSDVFYIINELLELNKNLEFKVAERIVDIIDKESNLRSILDNSDSLVWLINSRMELMDFNVAFSDAMKLKYYHTPEVNQLILDVISNEEDQALWKERYEQALEGEGGIYIETELNPIKNEELIYEIRTYPIEEVGKIKGVAVFQKDITELKKNELSLLEKNNDLEKVNKELDSFVYRVSHDLRAPLTSILGLINVMRIEDDPVKLKEFIHYQEKSVKKLDKFIFDIISLSRNARQELDIKPISFETLFNKIFESQTYAIGSEYVDKQLDIDIQSTFYSDYARLNVVFSNLISNAIKYRDRRKEHQYVNVSISGNNDECKIIITDNGIGIEDQYIDKIFNMFFRAHNEITGSGIGLYIVKETIEKLFGNLQVASKPKEGTTFTVVLPNLKEQGAFNA